MPGEIITKMVQNDVQALGVRHATIFSFVLPTWFSGERQMVGN